MAELKATVCMQGKDIEVISSHIEFNRKTDNKGRPVTNVIGGRITITVESTRETTIQFITGKANRLLNKRG